LTKLSKKSRHYLALALLILSAGEKINDDEECQEFKDLQPKPGVIDVVDRLMRVYLTFPPPPSTAQSHSVWNGEGLSSTQRGLPVLT
jgi:hypothetical protein